MARGFGGALEIRYSGAGFTGAKEEALSLFVTVQAHLIDTGSGKPIWLRGLVYESPTYSAGRWLGEDAALIRATLERAYGTLAERIVALAFLSTEPSTAAETKWDTKTCGVTPTEPGPALEAVSQCDPRSKVNTPFPALGRASALTPLLAWEATPVPMHFWTGDPWSAAKDLRYDLRVRKVVDDALGDIVYERIGLSGTQHRVSVALEPATTYFWSVRLRATVDSRPRAAPWSFVMDPQFNSTRLLNGARVYALAVGDELKGMACNRSWAWCGCLDFIPAAGFYRFRTP